MSHFQFITKNETDTKNFAKSLATHLKKNDIIVLTGELGSGKTKFVEGILSHFDLENEISSPTFTIVNEYQKDEINIYHFDVYRIGDVEEMDEIGYEDYIYGEGVSLIEWADLIEEILPEHYTEVRIEKEPERGFDYRRISICGY